MYVVQPLVDFSRNKNVYLNQCSRRYFWAGTRANFHAVKLIRWFDQIFTLFSVYLWILIFMKTHAVINDARKFILNEHHRARWAKVIFLYTCCSLFSYIFIKRFHSGWHTRIVNLYTLLLIIFHNIFLSTCVCNVAKRIATTFGAHLLWTQIGTDALWPRSIHSAKTSCWWVAQWRGGGDDVMR